MSECILCCLSEKDELKFGELLTSGDVTVHQFCLYFAPALFQRGSDDEGIQGFLIEDIKKEARRVRPIKCYFCHETNANLGCCVSKCMKAYHIDCAIKNNVSFEFDEHFPTFCRPHANFKVAKKINYSNCGICMTTIRTARSIQIPCCKNSFFHVTCLQKYANTSGVYFKCPMCNDTAVCKEKLPKMGIFLPEKDADWEFDYDAYENLNETLEKICDNEECQSDETFNDAPSRWKLCSTCGASAIHLKCLKDDSEFVCRSCDEVLNRSRKVVSDKEETEGSEEGTQASERKPLEAMETEETETTRLSREGTPEAKTLNESSSDEDTPIRKPKKKKSKFCSWFSDDELFDLNASDDEKNLEESPVLRRKRTLRKRGNRPNRITF